MARTEVPGTQVRDSTVSLTADVTGTLTVANGGTGSTTLALNNVLLGNGTGALQAVAPSTSGNVLTSNGTTWSSTAIPTLNQNTTGSAATLTTGRTIALSGAVTGTATSFNGSANITIPTTVSATAGGVIYGSSTTAYASTAASTAGYFLVSGGTGAPTWQINDMTAMPGASFKKSVRVATTANITLSAPQTIDGIAAVAGDRVLVKNQTAAADNGIYQVNAGAWTRVAGGDNITEIAATVVAVDSGTVHGGQVFATTLKTTDTLGTTAMNWYQVYSTLDSATANTASKLVLRDASGNFSAGTITAALSGNATTATSATSANTATTATYVTTGTADNTAGTWNIRVLRNSNTTTSNDGMFIGYGNSNSAATRLYGGGDTANPVSVTTGGALAVPGALTGSSTVQGTRLISTIATGTAPLTVTSTTLVTNLNANYVAGITPSTSAATTSIAQRDANANITAVGFIPGFTTTATAAGTTTLTVASNPLQEFTGTTTQTVVLPTTGVVAGQQYKVLNNSTGSVTVQSSALATVTTVLAGTEATFTALVATPTTAANWEEGYYVGAASTMTLTNKTIALGSNTVSGTLAQFNTAVTDADLARTDAANTFTGVQTMTSPALTTPAITGAITGTYSFGGTPTWPTFNQNTTGTASNVTGTVAVANGGTGATTLTGLVKGTGTTAMVAATAGTDYVAPSGALGTPSSGTLTNCTGLPLAGLASAAYATAATASTLAQRDANANITADNFINAVDSTATAAGTTTLTIASAGTQVFTGTTTQTVLMPTTGVVAGMQWTILNQSTGAVAIQSSTGAAMFSLSAGYAADVTCLLNTPTTAAHWRGTLWAQAAGLVATTSNTLAAFGQSTTNAIGVGTIELGHASDTTLSRSAAGTLAVEGVVVPTISSTSTLTNKRITARIGTTTSTATPSIDCGLYDQYNITALAVAITGVTITGTPTDGQKLMIRIKGDATPRAITWGASFVSSGVAVLPTTTVASKTHLVGFLYDSVAAKWVCVASDSAGY